MPSESEYVTCRTNPIRSARRHKELNVVQHTPVPVLREVRGLAPAHRGSPDIRYSDPGWVSLGVNTQVAGISLRETYQ